MVRFDNINRRTVLKTTPVIVGLSAGCTGGSDNEATPVPTSTPMETEAPQQQETEEMPMETETQETTPSYEEAVASLIEAAEEEGKVVVRVPARGDTAPLIGEFLERDTNVVFEQFGGSVPQHIAQSVTEMQVGKLSTDILMTQSPSDRLLAMEQDAMKANALPPAFDYGRLADIMTPEWDDQQRWLVLTGSARPLAFNTDLVSPDEAPQTWEECLDPRWEESFIVDTDNVVIMDKLLRDLGSWDAALQWLEDFRPQIKRLATSSFSSTQDLGNGRAKFFITAPSSLAIAAREDDGFPIDFNFLNNAAYLSIQAVGTLRDAPHPNAARLFMEIAARDETLQRDFEVARDYPLNPDLWTGKLAELRDSGGDVHIVDIPFVLETQRVSGLSRAEIVEVYQDLIGAV